MFKQSFAEGGIVLLKNLFIIYLSFIVLLSMSACTNQNENNKNTINTTNQNIENEITILDNENEALAMPAVDMNGCLKAMRKIAVTGAVSAEHRDYYISDFQDMIPVSQLRAIKLEGDISYIKFYSVNIISEELRLFSFYNTDNDGKYVYLHNIIVNNSLKSQDFENFNEETTLDDVKKLDASTEYNFFNPDTETPNYYLKFLDNDWSERKSNYFSVHILNDALVNISYQKDGNNYIVDKIDIDKEFEIIKGINQVDLQQ